MLSDAEQRRLTEIESSLRADDPRFARRLERGSRWRGAGSLLAAVAAVVAAVVGLVVGSVGMVVVALVVLGAALGGWLTHRAPGRPPSGDGPAGGRGSGM